MITWQHAAGPYLQGAEAILPNESLFDGFAPQQNYKPGDLHNSIRILLFQSDFKDRFCPHLSRYFLQLRTWHAELHKILPISNWL